MPYSFKNQRRVTPVKALVAFFLMIGLTHCPPLHAQGGHHGLKCGLSKLPEGQMQLKFFHHSGRFLHQDSVLILFARTDRSGSNIISEIFTMNNSHCVLIPRIPSGRYFITVQCLGKHHDYWETTTSVRPRKRRILKIKLETCDESTHSLVLMPGYRPALETGKRLSYN
jgi:hypothetical protein